MSQTPPASLREPRQTSSRVLLIRPGAFGRNEAAAATNAFMREASESPESIAALAAAEADALAQALSQAGVEVVVDREPDLPDSVFPNNWISFHQPEGRGAVVVTYPMATPARRLERRESVLDRVRGLVGGGGLERIALEHLEDDGEIVEGTGSLVLDRVAGVAFACRSPRTTDGALDAWEAATGFETVRFDAFGPDGTAVYHTNVVMSVGTRLAVFASCTVPDPGQRAAVRNRLEGLGKTVLDIDHTQVGGMCANVLELRAQGGEPVVAMSDTAWRNFTGAQRGLIESLACPVVVPIPTIERVGGGSVRCMIAELGSHAL